MAARPAAAAAPAPPSRPAAGGGDTTGVTADSIKIGVHAPVTGAAAVPQSSFERAVGVYFKAVNKRGGIFGRKIEVFFEDDQFRPDVARVKCKEMAEQEEVFLLIGGAGADQIDACARYAASVGVPYLSAGVHQTRPGQVPLGDLPTYFALSLTYEQQVPMLARLYREPLDGDKRRRHHRRQRLAQRLPRRGRAPRSRAPPAATSSTTSGSRRTPSPRRSPSARGSATPAPRR